MSAHAAFIARAQRRWLALAHAITFTFSALVILVFVYAATQFYAYAIHLPPPMLPNARWTPDMLRAALAAMGWSPAAYVFYYLAVVTFQALCFAVVALVILWRRRDSPFALLLAFELIYIGMVANSVFSYVYTVATAAQAVIEASGWVLWPGFFICFYLFPDGRFVPRWTRWCAVAWGLFSLMGVVATRGGTIPLFVFLPMLALIVTALGAPIYRFLKVADPVQHQQIKVVIAAVAAILLVFPAQALANQLYGNVSTTADGLRWHLASLLIGDVLSVFPLAIGVAILRYRLWDIDLIIRRTLVYGTLTGVLLAVYLGSVVLLQGLFRSLIGHEHNLAIVVATLVSAALVQPLRRRIQGSIDRRFYRRKYDAAQVLAAFSATLRDEVDLTRLSDDLLTVVEETMQPTHVSLWLRHPSRPPASPHPSIARRPEGEQAVGAD